MATSLAPAKARGMLLVLNIFIFFQNETDFPIVTLFVSQLAFVPAFVFIRQARERRAAIYAWKPAAALSIADLIATGLKVFRTSP